MMQILSPEEVIEMRDKAFKLLERGVCFDFGSQQKYICAARKGDKLSYIKVDQDLLDGGSTILVSMREDLDLINVYNEI